MDWSSDVCSSDLFAEGNILQIIVFAIALGVSINLIGERGAPAVRLFDALAESFYKLTDLVMRVAPIGVFALTAGVAGSPGAEVLLPLAGVLGVVSDRKRVGWGKRVQVRVA